MSLATLLFSPFSHLYPSSHLTSTMLQCTSSFPSLFSYLLPFSTVFPSSLTLFLFFLFVFLKKNFLFFCIFLLAPHHLFYKSAGSPAHIPIYPCFQVFPSIPPPPPPPPQCCQGLHKGQASNESPLTANPASHVDCVVYILCCTERCTVNASEELVFLSIKKRLPIRQ